MELAKAYMGSRVSTVPPLALSWRSHLFHEYKKVPTSLTSATKPFDLKGPRSVRFSGSTVIPESGYLTPRSSGRSTMYRMTCSPYIKVSDVVGDVHIMWLKIVAIFIPMYDNFYS